MNVIVIHGRLTKKPELKVVGSGQEVCKITVASDRYAGKTRGKETDFFDVDVWGAKAALVDKYFDVGDGIAIHGEMQSRKYDDNEGKKRTAWSVKALDIEFAEKRNKGGAPNVTAVDGFVPMGDDFEDPFL